ncbi:hypothetical protein SD71_00765 [Cohnella kolymensis]|uniref:Uncharacterized protein n=1 Tax=Cohnella kolymensis TaxID=1590652 RepID=A0ABR5A880_9BACL|nr:hypothetical protein [Cohnella kolymensis]KIL37276.1 hypothetical protein SD71_00765 [Cohnella kolymensis]
MYEDLEFDSDAREDRNQEAQLDRSFEDWMTSNIEAQARLQRDITDVPDENVIDAADAIDDT